MSLLIKGGEIVTASERYVADIFCENETITRIDRNIAPPKGAVVIDAIHGRKTITGAPVTAATSEPDDLDAHIRGRVCGG